MIGQPAAPLSEYQFDFIPPGSTFSSLLWNAPVRWTGRGPENRLTEPGCEGKAHGEAQRNDNLSQVSVADITYIAIATGFVYLGAILDAWSRRVFGYAIGKRIDARCCLPHSGPPSSAPTATGCSPTSDPREQSEYYQHRHIIVLCR